MNLQIKNSYKVVNPQTIRDILLTFEKLPRSLESCMMEWEAHNLLWYCHLFRDHTTDVDINDDESKIRLIIYSFLSLIYRKVWKTLTNSTDRAARR